MAYDCHVARNRLEQARSRKDAGEAWEISNTMRAHGCPPNMLRGLGGAGKKRTCKHGRTKRGTCRKQRRRR